MKFRALTPMAAVVLVCIAAVACTGPGAGEPSGEWPQLAAPEQAGWSAAGLAESRAFAEKAGTAAVVAVHGGRVVVAWGDVARRFELHSVRKSLVSALTGALAADKRLDLGRTLADLGIDDREPLTEMEKRARWLDLLRSRSGLYHPAAKETSGTKAERPERGSRAPGEAWWYNNWDFNTAGVILERESGERLFEAFERRIARPVGMEDYRAADGFEQYERTLSQHPAHAFRMSARDLARFGLLFLRRGAWNGASVVPSEWVAESTRIHSETGQGRGYGLMWWVYPAGTMAGYPALDAHDKFAAVGSGGQLVVVVPGAGFVYVHLADTENGRSVSGRDAWRLAEMILASRTGLAQNRPAVKPLEPVPFPNALPPPFPDMPEIILEAAALRRFVGTYELGPGQAIDVHLYGDRLAAALTGFPEVDLFPVEPAAFLAKAASALVRFETDAAGAVNGLAMTYLGREQRGVRRNGSQADL